MIHKGFKQFYEINRDNFIHSIIKVLYLYTEHSSTAKLEDSLKFCKLYASFSEDRNVLSTTTAHSALQQKFAFDISIIDIPLYQKRVKTTELAFHIFLPFYLLQGTCHLKTTLQNWDTEISTHVRNVQ